MELNDQELEKVTGGMEADQKYTVICNLGLIVKKSISNLTLEQAQALVAEKAAEGIQCRMTVTA